MVIINVKEFGQMVFEMDYENAKNTAANFVTLAREGFYNGLIFHRIIKGFMVQGGDPSGNGTGGASYNIKGEFAANGIQNELKHIRGVISMARAMDMDSQSSQFFIMHQDAPHLDGQYAAFGKIIEGEEVLDKIASVKTNYEDRPLQDVVIDSIEVKDEPTIEVEKIY